MRWEQTTFFDIQLKPMQYRLQILSETPELDARDEIIKIIKNAEKELRLPKGVLQDIYNDEAELVHLDFRNNYTANDGKLRKTILQYFEQIK